MLLVLAGLAFKFLRTRIDKAMCHYYGLLSLSSLWTKNKELSIVVAIAVLLHLETFDAFILIHLEDLSARPCTFYAE